MTTNQPKSRSNTQTSTGLVPPNETKLEEAVIGAMMLEANLYFELAGFVSASIFWDNRHAVIFSAIKSLADENNPIDLYTVSERLKKIGKLKDIGGAAYLSGLTQTVGSAAHAHYHAKVLHELWIMRTMASELSTLLAKCYDSEFDILTGEYQTTLSRLDSLFAGSGTEKHIRAILKRHKELIDERLQRASRNEIQGLSYGLSKLDELTGGMQSGQLIIIAARPAMGKTAIALKFAKAPALNGAAVTFASLEMTDLSLTDRLISSYAGVDGGRLKSGRMNRDDVMAYERAASALSKLNISIDDTAGTTLGRLSAMSRTKHRKGDLDLLIIDYLQLVESDTDSRDYRRNREQEVANITRGLKKLAKDLGIPIILLCQLNRNVESRQDKQPQIHDLRESGGIEQDADVVLMPFRPSYYKDIEFADDKGNVMPPDAGLIFVRKQREGGLGEVEFRFSYDLAKIEDYDSPNEYTENGLF